MPATTFDQAQGSPHYDPRWFVWSIVFLVVTGISLVSYIVLSDTSSADAEVVVVHRTANHQPAVKTPVRPVTASGK